MAFRDVCATDGALLSRAEQHGLLAERIRGLADLMRDAAEDMTYREAARRLRDLLAAHFAAEALDLSQMEAAVYDEHVAHHKAILARIDQTLARFDAGPSNASRFAVLDAFETCLYEHEVAYEG